MKVAVWNLKWSRRAIHSIVRQILTTELPDVFCLTESTDFFVPDYPNTISATADYGYRNDGTRRKVWLVSQTKWAQVEQLENTELPPGRFVSGVAEGIRFVGVCVPWSGAHVASGNKNRKLWEDHKKYLQVLKVILDRYAHDKLPVCILGDFNQRVPASSTNAKVIKFLEDAMGDKYSIHTANQFDVDGKQLIDHVATTRALRFKLDRTVGRSTQDGICVSDHPALFGTLTWAQEAAHVKC